VNSIINGMSTGWLLQGNASPRIGAIQIGTNKTRHVQKSTCWQNNKNWLCLQQIWDNPEPQAICCCLFENENKDHCWCCVVLGCGMMGQKYTWPDMLIICTSITCAISILCHWTSVSRYWLISMIRAAATTTALAISHPEQMVL